MSAALVEPAPLFHSPVGLYAFQGEAAARAYWRITETDEPVDLVLFDTGMGKTVLSIATACLLIEDGKVDHVVVVAEANKVLDWFKKDFPRFSDLDVALYSGNPLKRAKIRDNLPQVIVTSYETSRNDICKFRARSTAVVEEGPLTTCLKDKRVLFIYDEFSRLRSRTSKTYVATDYLINRVMRKRGNEPAILGLTATSVEKDPSDHWNAGRILSPKRSGTVEDFKKNYIHSYDIYEQPFEWKNITAEDCEVGVTPLNALYAPLTIRKRKTDPDVIDQFPAKIEEPPILVELHQAHQDFYDAVEEMYADPTLPHEVQRIGFGLLRQICDHPMALLVSDATHPKAIVNTVGAAYIESLAVAKVEQMLAWQHRMAEQQTVIFTFYGKSVLPLLQHALEGQGYKVSVNHGSMSQEAKGRSQDAYLAGDTQIFLSSDAGAKGLNLGCGSGLLHYEPPAFWSTYDQRSNRIHRIDSIHPSVTIDMLLADKTLEVPVAHKMLGRAQWGEDIQDADLTEADDDGSFLRASDRAAMLRRAR